MVSIDKEVSDIIKDMTTTNSAKDAFDFRVSEFNVGYLVKKFSPESLNGVDWNNKVCNSRKGESLQQILVQGLASRVKPYLVLAIFLCGFEIGMHIFVF